jgi:hypothetical protein
MENQFIKDTALTEVPVQHTRRRLERVARIAYLIAAALLLYALLLSAKVRASDTAALAGNHPVEAYNLTARAPASATLRIELSFAVRNRAKLNELPAKSCIEALSSLADFGRIRCPLWPDRDRGRGSQAMAREPGTSCRSIVTPEPHADGHGGAGGSRVHDHDRGVSRRLGLLQCQ